MIKNDVKNQRGKCQVVIFPWDNNITSDNFSNSQLSASSMKDITKRVMEIGYEKSLADPAGSFEITLPNDRDWKQEIKPGYWLLIYMSNTDDLSVPSGTEEIKPRDLQGQSDKLRCIGYVERVSAKGNVNDKGAYDTTYSVTGRDFGVVYQETQIWHNTVFFERNLIDAATARLNSNTIKTVDGLIDTMHRLMFSPADFKGLALSNKSLTKTALQWLMPTKLLQSVNAGFSRGAPFIGNVNNLLQFESTRCTYPVENPLSLLNGRAWDVLKSHSIELFHELFTELGDDGHPHLIFRPIPWRVRQKPIVDRLFINTSRGLFGNVDRVQVPAVDIIDFDIGEDNHTRYNLFFTTVNSSLYSVQDSIAGVNNNDPRTGFPRIQQSSIKRHGLRLMYNEIDAMIQLNTEKIDKKLLEGYNELILEYWNNAVFLESGNMTVNGNNGIKIGKVVEIEKDTPYNSEKLFYIEGYKDTFIVEERGVGEWTQNLSLTRGIEKQDLIRGQGSVARRDNEHTDIGEFTEDEN